MSPRLTHIALHVRDLDACIEFYRSFCRMKIAHERRAKDSRVVWLSERGREQDFVFVLMDGGADLKLAARDYRHFGFAVPSRAAVDAIAARARARGCLLWEPKDEPFPVGYYCGLEDPNGNQVEFSWGQPLGPGAPELEVFADPRQSKGAIVKES